MEEILASIRRIISEESGESESESGRPTEATVEPAGGDVLELTETIDDEPEPAAEPLEQADELEDYDDDDEIVAEDVFVDPGDEDADAWEKPGEPPPAAPAAPEVERLVSPGAAALSAAAFANLAGPRITSEMGVGASQTVEGLVCELLRPMLKQWLDVHLPSIVENAVRDEISRIAREAKGE